MKLRKRILPVYIDICIIFLTCFLGFFIENFSLGDLKNTLVWKLIIISSSVNITILYFSNAYYSNLQGNKFSLSKDLFSITKGILISAIIVGAIFSINVSWRKTDFFLRLILIDSILLSTLSITRYFEFVLFYKGKKIVIFIASRNYPIIDAIKNDMLSYGRNNWAIFRLNKKNRFKLIIGDYKPEEIKLDYSFLSDKAIEPHSSTLNRMFHNKEYIPIVLTDQSISQDSIICEFLVFCYNNQVQVIRIFDFYESICQKAPLFLINGQWVWDYSYLRYSPLKFFVKRVFDIALICLLLPGIIAIGLIIAILIKIESRGAVFFVQERSGMRKKVFKMYKFRTMVSHPDDSKQWPKMERDLITRLGRILRETGLDEIPQFINILKGEMSFVGPRPARPEVADLHCSNIPFFALTHSVLPGITGWAQLHQGTDSGYETIMERVRYNIYYLKNNSIWMDLYIIIRTAKMIFYNNKPQATYKESIA